MTVHADSPETAGKVQPELMSDEAYRAHCWGILRQISQLANENPGQMVNWRTEDRGDDVSQLHHLMLDWLEADPKTAGQFQYGLSDDDLTFSIWIETELPEISAGKSDFERQQAAAQRQAALAMGNG
jgi:hypothetical protein